MDCYWVTGTGQGQARTVSGTVRDKHCLQQKPSLFVAVEAGGQGQDAVIFSVKGYIAGDLRAHIADSEHAFENFAEDIGIGIIEGEQQMAGVVGIRGEDLIGQGFFGCIDIYIPVFSEEIGVDKKMQAGKKRSVFHVVAVDNGVSVGKIPAVIILGEDRSGGVFFAVQIAPYVITVVVGALQDGIGYGGARYFYPGVDIGVDLLQSREIDSFIRDRNAGRDFGDVSLGKLFGRFGNFGLHGCRCIGGFGVGRDLLRLVRQVGSGGLSCRRPIRGERELRLFAAAGGSAEQAEDGGNYHEV